MLVGLRRAGGRVRRWSDDELLFGVFLAGAPERVVDSGLGGGRLLCGAGADGGEPGSGRVRRRSVTLEDPNQFQHNPGPSRPESPFAKPVKGP
jgi:hypothetical protein